MQMVDAATYPHAYARLIVVRRYFGVPQRVLNRWHEQGLLPIENLAGVRRILVANIVQFERTSGVRKAC